MTEAVTNTKALVVISQENMLEKLQYSEVYERTKTFHSLRIVCYYYLLALEVVYNLVVLLFIGNAG